MDVLKKLDLQLSLDKKKTEKIEVTEDMVRNNIDGIANLLSFYREYPDLFLDTLKPKDSPFNFFFYQRVFLRNAMRHKYFFGTFPRAYSKSFLSIMILMTKCMLYPGAKLFICSGGKEQAANIAKEKVEEILDIFPAFRKEIDWKKTQFSKDYVKVSFKNGARFDVVAVRESSRGGRRHGGLVEEVLLVDGELLNTVIIPLMNVNRRTAAGLVDPNETLNKSQCFITTAGFKSHYSYAKMIQLLIWQVVRPGSSCVCGGTYRVPVAMGLLDRSFVNDLKADGTFNEVSFAREYESVWAGSSEEAFFSSEQFDKCRVLNQPEHEFSKKGIGNYYYIMGIDVARSPKGCQTVATIIKVQPRPNQPYLKSVVNMFTIEGDHFLTQAIFIKRKFYDFNCKAIIIDGNGLGIGLVDFLVLRNLDEATGEEYPPFGIMSETDPERHYAKMYRDDPETEKEAIYIIKANSEINSEAYVNLQSQMGSGALRMLIDERTAKAKLLGTKVGMDMSPTKRGEYLMPFTLTSILKEEMMNLIQKDNDQASTRVTLERVSRKIGKDKFSALIYGLYYIKMLEEKDKKKKKFKVTDMCFGAVSGLGF